MYVLTGCTCHFLQEKATLSLAASLPQIISQWHRVYISGFIVINCYKLSNLCTNITTGKYLYPIQWFHTFSTITMVKSQTKINMINISVSYINAVADTVVFTWCHLATSPSKSGKKKKSVQSYTLFSELRYLSFELKWAVACFCFLTNIDCLPWCTSRSIRHDIRPARLFHPKFCLSISWRWHHLQLCPLGCGSVACQRLECFQQTSNPNNLFFYFTNYLCIYMYI